MDPSHDPTPADPIGYLVAAGGLCIFFTLIAQAQTLAATACGCVAIMACHARGQLPLGRRWPAGLAAISSGFLALIFAVVWQERMHIDSETHALFARLVAGVLTTLGTSLPIGLTGCWFFTLALLLAYPLPDIPLTAEALAVCTIYASELLMRKFVDAPRRAAASQEDADPPEPTASAQATAQPSVDGSG